MKIIFTIHARSRALMRGISTEEIENVIRNPEKIEAGKYNRIIAYRKIKDEIVKVVYAQENEKIIVLTVIPKKLSR